MRRVWTIVPMILLLMLMLTACGIGGDNGEQLALDVRARMLEATGGQMEVELVADYEDRVYTYTVSFQWEKEGRSVLRILEPENIAGVEAILEQGETTLEFDGARLETGALNPNGLAPVDALPAMLTACQEGYISDVGTEKLGEEDAVRVTYGSGQGEVVDAVQYRMWLRRSDGQILAGEVVSGGRTVVACTFLSVSFT